MYLSGTNRTSMVGPSYDPSHRSLSFRKHLEMPKRFIDSIGTGKTDFYTKHLRDQSGLLKCEGNEANM